ncbi:MAG: hypothetical protein HYW85_02710 [Deltaproteobacteria bacterium]|nr:hypothetical protein [Deltaproteobacteria bacterium]
MKKITSSMAILSAFFASACCLLPLLLAGVAGIIGIASFLEGFRPLFLGIAILFLGYGFYVAYFQKKKECAPGEVCSTDQGKHTQRIVLWIVTFFVVAMSTFPYWVRLFSCGRCI